MALTAAPDLLLVVAAVLPPLCMAGRPPWATALTALLGGAACLAAMLVHRSGWGRPSLLVTLAIAGLLWTALGAIPVPVALIRALTAGSAEPIVVEHAAIASALLGRPAPTWIPWSTSPLETREAVIVGGAVLSYVAAGGYFVARGRRRAVLRAVALSTVAMALVVMGHIVVGTNRVYGIIEPIGAMPIPSPLVNENHLAGFLAFGAPLCLGLASTARDRAYAAGWLVGAALCGVLCLAAVSRGGTLGLVVALLTFAGLALASRAKGAGSRVLSVLGGIGVVVFALGLAVYAWRDALESDFRGTTLYKLRLALQGLDLVARSPWVGVGRGGYSTAFVGLAGMDVRYEYPECFPVQWVAEWGLPFAAFLGAALVLLVVRTLRRPLSIERMAAVATLAGLAVHELVDFATEMPGTLVVAALLVVGALENHEPHAEPGSAPRGTTLTRMIAIPITTLVLGLAGLSFVGTNESLRREAIEAAIAREDWAAADRITALAIEERPGEPDFLLLGAYARALRDDRATLEWVNAVMRVAPHWSSPHLVAARWMAAHGALTQAWLELREVERRDPGRSIGIACVLLRSPASAQEAIRLMADEPGGTDYLEGVVEQCAGTADADAIATVDAVLLADRLPAARVRGAIREVAAHEPEQALELLHGLSDDDPSTAFVRADALSAADRPEEAVAVLERTHVTTSVRAEWLARLARAQAAAGDVAEMRETIHQLQGEAAGRRAGAASALILLAELESGLGNRSEAYAALQRADEIDPSSDALERALRYAQAQGDTHRATTFRMRLCERTSAPAGCTSAHP